MKHTTYIRERLDPWGCLEYRPECMCGWVYPFTILWSHYYDIATNMLRFHNLFLEGS